MDEEGKMLQDFEIATINQDMRAKEIILKSDHTRRIGGANFAGHMFEKHVKSVTGEKAMGLLKQLVSGFINNSSYIRNNLEFEDFPEFRPHARKVKDPDTMKTTSLPKIARVYADQLVSEVKENIRYKNAVALKVNESSIIENQLPLLSTCPHDYTSKDAPHKLINQLGGPNLHLSF